MARRTLSFLAQELEILEMDEVMEGSEDCWVVQVCLEEVQTCEANIVRVAVYSVPGVDSLACH